MFTDSRAFWSRARTIYRFWFGDAEPFLELFREKADQFVVAGVCRTVVVDGASYAGVGVDDRGQHCGIDEQSRDCERRREDDGECMVTARRRHRLDEHRAAADDRRQTQDRVADRLELGHRLAVPLHDQPAPPTPPPPPPPSSSSSSSSLSRYHMLQ